jgi:hypothetical protein
MSKVEGRTAISGTTADGLQRTAMTCASQLYEIRHIIDASQAPDDLKPALELATRSRDGLRLIVEELERMIDGPATVESNREPAIAGGGNVIDPAWAGRR